MTKVRNRLQRIAPVIGLLLMAPWVGEFLLGSSPIQNLLASLILIVPIYGGGALLIREVARRTRRGWPSIVLLGAAYGVIEAGLLDQSLFNPAFLEEGQPRPALIPFLDMSAIHAISYVTGHAIWSITISIAMVEMLTPSRSVTPWLGRRGLVWTVVLYLLGCAILFGFIYAEYKFIASPRQLFIAAVTAIALIIAAFSLTNNKRLPQSTSSGAAVKPWITGVGSFAITAVFIAIPENWAGVGIGLLLLGSAWLFISYISNREWWSLKHRFALISGAVITYACCGFVVTSMLWPDDSVAWIGNVIFALMAVVLLIVIHRKISTGNQTDPTID